MNPLTVDCPDCIFWYKITEYCELGKHQGVEVMLDYSDELEEWTCADAVPKTTLKKSKEMQ